MDFREDINGALKVLREGGTIIYPTDTIWGLGCDATNQQAVEKIYAIKKRGESKSLIILVNGYQMLERYVETVPEAAASILDVADKPMTIIYPKGKNLAPAVLSADGSVGIRICSDGFCNELITRFRKPIVSTSANISDTPAPRNFQEIDDEIIRAADYAVKHRQWETEIKTPSSVIKVGDDGVIKIIRQ